MEYSRAGYEEDKLDKARINLLIHFFINEEMAMYEYLYNV